MALLVGSAKSSKARALVMTKTKHGVLGFLGCPAFWPGFVAGLVELALEGLINRAEGEHGGDSRQVEPVGKELADLAETGQVCVAVAAGTARATGRGDQSAGLIEAQVLGGATDEFGGDGDPVHPSLRVDLVDRVVWERHSGTS